jgi:hypothetical protein
MQEVKQKLSALLNKLENNQLTEYEQTQILNITEDPKDELDIQLIKYLFLGWYINTCLETDLFEKYPLG